MGNKVVQHRHKPLEKTLRPPTGPPGGVLHRNLAGKIGKEQFGFWPLCSQWRWGRGDVFIFENNKKCDQKWIEERPGIVPETKTSCSCSRSRHVKKKQNQSEAGALYCSIQSEAGALYCSIANIAERESKTYSKLKMID